MEEMGKDLIQLCDQLEQHGLVDYQMGIWEEEILCGRSTHKPSKSPNLIRPFLSPRPMPRSDGEQTGSSPRPDGA